MALLRLKPSNLDECLLIEVQGKFELVSEEAKKRNGEMKGVRIGSFKVSADQQSAEIKMGGNTLNGKIESLKKPLVIVRKTGRKERVFGSRSGSDLPAAPKIVSQFAHNKVISQCAKVTDFSPEILEIEAVIRKKAIFTKRPAIHVPPELIQSSITTKKKKKK